MKRSAAGVRISANEEGTGASTRAGPGGPVGAEDAPDSLGAEACIEVAGIFLRDDFGKCRASASLAWGPGLSVSAGKFLLTNMVAGSTVGQSVPRREGVAKVTGEARYTDDLVVPNAWYGKTIRSTVPRGTIRSITLDPEFDWSQVVVVTADDIPGDNVVQLIRDDQPVLAGRDGEVRHREEPILLLAAPNRELLEEAAGHIRIEYQPQSPVFEVTKATEVYSTIEITKGDVAAGEQAADFVVERTFRVGFQEQLYIEPQGAIAIPGEDGRGKGEGSITVIGSLQCT